RGKAPGPRPVAALREGLGLRAGFASRRTVAGNVSAIRQAGEAPSGAPRASPVPSGAGQVGPTSRHSRTEDHFPMGDTEATGCHPAGGPTSDLAAVLASESLDRPSA